MKKSGEEGRAQAATQAPVSGISTGTKRKDNLPSGQDPVKAGFGLQNKTMQELECLFIEMMKKDKKDPEALAFLAEFDNRIRKTAQADRRAMFAEIAALVKGALSSMSAPAQLLFLSKMEEGLDQLEKKIEAQRAIA